MSLPGSIPVPECTTCQVDGDALDPQCPVHGDDIDNPHHPDYPVLVHDRRSELRAALMGLRYSSSVPSPPAPHQEQTEADYLHEVTSWLRAFGQVLAMVSDTNTELAHELAELRSQRTAIRKFLGLTEGPVSP
jgi:hypothetical protein